MRARPTTWWGRGALVVAAVGTLVGVVRVTTDGDEPARPEPSIEGADDGLGDRQVQVRRQDLRSTMELAATTAALSSVVEAPAGADVVVGVIDGAEVAAGAVLGRAEPAAGALLDAARSVEDAELALAQFDAQAAAESAGNDATVAAARLAANRAAADLAARQSDDPAAGDLVELQRARDDAVAALDASEASSERASQLRTVERRGVVVALTRARDGRDALAGSAVDLVAPIPGSVTRTANGFRIDGAIVVQAPLLPLQLLRLRSATLSGRAEVETITGRQTVDCATIQLRQPVPSADQTPDGSGTADDAPPPEGTVECRPASPVDSVAGLAATISLDLLLGEDVLVLPDGAVRFDAAGAAFVVSADGSEIPVALGPTDGVLRIVDGVPAGTDVALP